MKRNDGQGGSIFVPVHTDLTETHPEVNEITITDLPSIAVKKVKFIVEVLTTFSWDEGVNSLTSDEYLIAEVPTSPTVAPTSGPTTGASIIDIVISAVT